MKYETLISALEHHATHHPSKAAFTLLNGSADCTETISFGELKKSALTLAGNLQQQHNIKLGEPVLLLLPTSIEFIKAFFACLYLGAMAVPCCHNTRDLKRLPGIAEDSGAQLVLTNTAGISSIPSVMNGKTLFNVEAFQYEAEETLLNAHLTSDTVAYLQYSSGSTGSPKGIMVTHKNLLHNLATMCESFGHNEHTKVMTWLPLFHDMGLIGNVLVAAYLGVECILLSPLNFLKRPFIWLKAISDYRVTFSGAPNFAYELCLYRISEEQQKTLDLSSWDVAFNGAEPVRAEVIENFAKKFSPNGFKRKASYPCYGLAESTLFVAGRGKLSEPLYFNADRNALENGKVVKAHNNGSRLLVSCGRTWAGHQITIMDPNTLQPSAPDSIGEICVSGPSLAKGYWRKTDLSQQTYITQENGVRLLRSGDLGFIKNNELYITGRSKDLIIIHGKNHHPEDIERTITASNQAVKPDACAAFSVVVDDQERLVVMQEIKREYINHFDEEKVRGDIIEAVTATHHIRLHDLILITPSNISKTSSGKIQRRACKEQYLNKEYCLANDLKLKRKSSNKQVQSTPVLNKNITIASGKLQFFQRMHAFFISILSLLGTVIAIAFAYSNGITGLDISLLVIMYSLTMLGMTVGYHRLFSHRAFEVKPLGRAIFAILGSMVAQGSVIYWVANHRRHHQYSDLPGDPHSPVCDGEKSIKGLQAFWHAHVGWMFTHDLSNPLHYCKDLIRDPVVTKISQSYYPLVLLGLLIPTVLGGLLTWSIEGAISGFLWGGIVRLFLSYHATSCINSVTHMFGNRPFNTKDKSRNTSWLAILTFGEAWHNNHHAFPSSAYFGKSIRQVDLGGYVIWILERLSLISHVRFPSPEKVNDRLSKNKPTLEI